MEGEGKRKKKKREKKVRAEVPGENRTRAPLLVKTAL